MRLNWLPESADTKWTPAADLLRTHPNEWLPLQVRSSNPSVDASRIRSGVLAAFRPRGHFEAEVRGGEIWARYSPPSLPTGDDSP